MDLIDRFRRGDIVFPNTQGFFRPGKAGGFDKPEGITGSGGGTYDVGRAEAGMDEFRGSNGLNNGLTTPPQKTKSMFPYLSVIASGIGILRSCVPRHLAR